MGRLKKVIAVAQSVELATGGQLFVTALEVWEGGLVLHTAEQLPEYLPPGAPIERRTLWTISDDLQTVYVPDGGSSSGSQGQRTSTWGFAPTPPDSATRLSILGPAMEQNDAIQIDIA